MKVSAQDRNTALTIALVLVVCTISLVAILMFLWQLMQPVINQVGGVLGTFSFQVTADYNFAVPTYQDLGVEDSRGRISAISTTADNLSVAEIERLEDNEQVAEPQIAGISDSGYDYNFKLPKKH